MGSVDGEDGNRGQGALMVLASIGHRPERLGGIGHKAQAGAIGSGHRRAAAGRAADSLHAEVVADGLEAARQSGQHHPKGP